MSQADCDLQNFEGRVFSQNGEDGVLQQIFAKIGTTNKYFVEFGVGPKAAECNTRLLREKFGWQGLLMDYGAPPNQTLIQREAITAENINELFAKYDVPHEFDLLSIDIDGNDFWVWKSLSLEYRPRVVVIEYNSSFPPPQTTAIEYDPNFRWQRTDYFGATLSALDELGKSKGYQLVYCERCGVNAFFIREDVCPYRRQSAAEIFRPPAFFRGKYFGLVRLLYWPDGYGHRKDPSRKMIDVSHLFLASHKP